MNNDNSTSYSYNTFAFATGILISLFGALILTGWELNSTALKTFGLSPVPMKPNPALAFFFSGLALIILSLKKKNFTAKLISKASASAVVLIGLLTIIEYLLQIDLHIDQLLFEETPGAVLTIIPGRMSFNLAIGLTSAGIALLLIGKQNHYAKAAVILSGSIGALAVLGYIFSFPVLLEMVGVNTIALNSAVCLIILSLGIYFTGPEREFEHSKIEKQSLIVLITIALILITSNIFTTILQNKEFHIDNQVEEINNVIKKIDQTLYLITDIESDSRGYVITGDEEFIRLFNKSKSDIHSELQDLKIITTDNQTRQYLDTLIKYLTEKISYNEAAISNRKNNKVHDAAARVLSQHDKSLTNNIQLIIAKMKSRENENYKNSQEQELGIDKESKSLQTIFMVVLFGFLIIIYFIISRDISDRTRAEALLKESEEKLSKLNAEKDKLFSIIAHDLRSPFTGLMSLTELMADDREPFTIPEYVKYSKDLNESARNIYKLVNNLFEWAQLQKGSIHFSPEKLSLQQIVFQEIESITLHSSNKNIITKNLIHESVLIYADRNMIHSVIRNLITNAIKYTEPGGCIVINSLTNNGTTEITVSDTGIGMSEDTIKKLFIIGEKTGSMGTAGELSTGLGLLLCKEFVDIHKGEIHVKSEPGKGSTFTVILPDNMS